MKRQWNYTNHLAHSTISDTFKSPTNTYSFTNLPNRLRTRSKQPTLEQSREKNINPYQHLGHQISINTYRAPENSLKEITHYQYKENPMRKDLELLSKRVWELQSKLIENDHRVETLERTGKNTTKLTATLEEFMKNQYADLKDREQLEERIGTFEQALGHLATIKADRKDLQNLQVGRYFGLNERCNGLERQHTQVQQEIADLHIKMQRMVGKIESSYLSMGEKYQEFIQCNIIKAIDNVNKLTQHYHLQIEQLTIEQKTISEKISVIQRNVNENVKRNIRHGISSQILAVSLPNIRIVQTLSIREQKKKSGPNFFKESKKEQHKEAVGVVVSSGMAESCSTSTTISDTLLNNMYDPIQQPSPVIDIQLEKVIYKLDSEFNLLDQDDHYLLTSTGSNIRLSQHQVSLLRENGLIF